ncbi:hypothetical protein V491_09052 [Pseudogymnoascus sp. VKM F-3775]|nr:hypothetical protein V491_09052 [Pseudogymnoascus sp. VKM F-3775]
MVKHSWKACFRRQEVAQQLCASDEQLPTYSKTQNQEQDDKTMNQFFSHAEGSSAHRKTEAKKLKAKHENKTRKLRPETESEKYQKQCYRNGLLTRLNWESNESLEKNKKSNLVDLLDMAREEALTPPEPNLAERFAREQGESSTMRSIEAQNMPIEKLSKLDLVELLRIYFARHKKEYRKRYDVPKYTDMISRHVQKEESHRAHESKTQEGTRVSKPEDMSPSLPSAIELELKELKEMIDKIKLESNNRFDKFEWHLKTLEKDLVEGRREGCRSATTESDIATGSSTGSCSESTNAAATSSQVEQEVDPVNQAREQTVQEMSAIVVKSFEVYAMLTQLKQYTAQNTIFGAQDFDDLTTKVIRVGRDLDNSTSRIREAIVKAVRHY